MSATLAIALVVLALIGLGIAAIFVHLAWWLLVAVGGLFIYFIPSIVAGARHHEHVLWVLVLNIALGWSGIAWIVLLIWAILGKSIWAKDAGASGRS
jgi:hypothetical protein